MNIRDLKPKEIMAVKEKVTGAVGINNRAYYGSGFNFAIKFAKIVEKCRCRCSDCQKPIIYPRDIDGETEKENLEEFGIAIYGGDVCGEINFCEKCWSKLSDRDKKRLAKSLLPKY